MSGPDHYVTAAMTTLVETRPIAAALEDWIRLAGSDAGREARTVEALAIIDRLGKFIAFEQLVVDAAADPPTNVRTLFEHRARRDWHPSMGDDAPAHGYPRPSAEAQEQAREEHRHDVQMGRYYEDGA